MSTFLPCRSSSVRAWVQCERARASSSMAQRSRVRDVVDVLGITLWPTTTQPAADAVTMFAGGDDAVSLRRFLRVDPRYQLPGFPARCDRLWSRGLASR